MSHAYRDAVWSIRGTIPPIDLLVLMEIADYTNGHQPADRGAWPSLSAIAKKVGVSRATAQRSVVRLSRSNLITVEPRFGPDGNRTSSIYRFTPHLTEMLPPSQIDTPPIADSDGPHRTERQEPRNRTTEDEPSIPPFPPSGGRRVPREPAPRERWSEVVEAARAGSNLRCPGIDKWTPTRDRQIRRLVEGLGARWSEFLSALRCSGVDAEITPLNVSLERLASNDCQRAFKVIEGEWFDKKAVARLAGERARADRAAAEAEIERRFQELKLEGP